MSTWTQDVEQVVDAMIAINKCIRTSESSKVDVERAIDRLHQIGAAIMKRTRYWPDIFKTASHLVKATCKNLSDKLANPQQIKNSLAALDNNQFMKVMNSIVMQDAQW